MSNGGKEVPGLKEALIEATKGGVLSSPPPNVTTRANIKAAGAPKHVETQDGASVTRPTNISWGLGVSLRADKSNKEKRQGKPPLGLSHADQLLRGGAHAKQDALALTYQSYRGSEDRAKKATQSLESLVSEQQGGFTLDEKKYKLYSARKSVYENKKLTF